MSEWDEFIKKIPEVAEHIRKDWDRPLGICRRNLTIAENQVLEKILHYYSVLRQNKIHPNAIEKILTKALENREELDKSVTKAFEEWQKGKDESWETLRHRGFFQCIKNALVGTYEKFGFPDGKPTLLYLTGKEKLRYLTPEEIRAMKHGEYVPKPKKVYPIEEIKKLREQGLSIREIAEKLKIPKSTINRLLKS